jgi:hypothetical protein
MKLISVDAARTSWIFPLTELNPTGRSFTKAFVDLATRYSFKKFPKHTLDLGSDNALTFDEGEFTNRDGVQIIIKLRVYTDGCVADCWSSTRDAEDFLKDAMQWLKDEHGFSLPADRAIRTIYLSELTVTTSKTLMTLNPKLRALTDALSAKVKEFGGADTGFNVGSIGFWSNDPKSPTAPGPFRFENKAGTLPEEKRYFSHAPLPTDAHLALLDKLEAILD